MKTSLISKSILRISKQITPQSEARKTLEDRRLIHAEGIGWVPKILYDKSIASGLLVNRDGWHSFAVSELESEEVVGYRGRTPIVEKRKKLNVQEITNFFKEKKEYEDLSHDSSEKFNEVENMR